MRTFFYYYLILIAITAASCSTAKRSTQTEEHTDQRTIQREAASDSSIIDYKVDTSKVCEQVLDFERVEYYNETYTDSTGKTRQMVKAVTRKKAGRVEAQKGTTEAHAVEVEKDTAMRAEAATVSVQTQTKEVKETRDRGALWAILIALLLTAGLYYYMKNKE